MSNEQDKQQWHIDGGLIYSLKDGVNHNEINVTMADGRRDTAARHAVAKALAGLMQSAPAAANAGGQTDWRELCRRLYVELFHCDQQMMDATDEEGELLWTQGSTVRDVLHDAKTALGSRPTATSAAKNSEQTDLSKRLRMTAERHSSVPSEMAIAAAHEIERYYSGMLAWKATAEAKDCATSAAATPQDERESLAGVIRSAGHYVTWKQAREIADAVAALSHQAERDYWQPIETAPKDGSSILLARGPRVTSGYWWEEEGYIKEKRDMDGNYLGQDESDGIACWMSADGGFSDDEPPTHWQPMPNAPAAMQQSASNKEG